MNHKHTIVAWSITKPIQSKPVACSSEKAFFAVNSHKPESIERNRKYTLNLVHRKYSAFCVCFHCVVLCCGATKPYPKQNHAVFHAVKQQNSAKRNCKCVHLSLYIYICVSIARRQPLRRFHSAKLITHVIFWLPSCC